MKNLQETTIKKGVNNKTAKLVGALFLIAMAASLIGGSIVESITSSSNYFTELPENKLLLLIGVLLEVINGISVVGIGVLMFPILKKYNESMALGYLAFRIIEAIFCCSIVITPLSLLELSHGYLKAGNLDAQYLQASSVLSIAQRASINALLIPVFFCLGAILFYFLLYKTKIISRFISIWGFIGVILVFIMNIFILFQAASTSTGLLIVLALPIILNEIFLGIWLIVKGFNPSAISSLSGKSE